MPLQRLAPRMGHQDVSVRPSGLLQGLERAGLFLWSISWPELELVYLSPSAPGLTGGRANHRGDNAPITSTGLASAVSLPSQLTEQTLIASLWTHGWCEFDFALTPPDSVEPSWFHCRAVVVHDTGGHPRRIDGVAFAMGSGSAPGARPIPYQPLNEVAFGGVQVDDELRILLWPASLEDALGVGEEAARGQPLTRLFRLDGALLGPESDRPRHEMELLNGKTVVGSVAGRQVLLQYVAEVGNDGAVAIRHVLVTVLGRAAMEESQSSSARWSAMMRRTPDLVILAQSQSLSILEASAGARSRLGGGGAALEGQPLKAMSPELAATLEQCSDYLDSGCTLAAACAVASTGDDTYEFVAYARLWDTDDSQVIVIRLREVESDWEPVRLPSWGAREAARLPAADIATVLVARDGDCQVIAVLDDEWRDALEGSFGVSLFGLATDADALRRAIDAGFGGGEAAFSLNVAGRALRCSLAPFHNDGGDVVALVGSLAIARGR